MRKPLWTPSSTVKKRANVTRFMGFVNKRHGLGIDTYDGLYLWSINYIEDFWAAFWDFAGIRASGGYDAVVDDLKRFPGARWFPGARLNFAENLLQFTDDRPALIQRGEGGGGGGERTAITYSGLHQRVAALAAPLRAMGLEPGDRVGAYMPNLTETVVAMLAVASVGGVWASCGAELGAEAVVERLGQIGPRVLFTVDGYYYKGKKFNILPNVEKVVRSIPTLERVVVFPHVPYVPYVPYVEEEPDIARIPGGVLYNEFIAEFKIDSAGGEGGGIQFVQLPFDHPLYIMFSSGTTGRPKCMVQGAGGVLINHLKELLLHTDLRREDCVTYITSPSWMMWNWLVTSLAVGSSVVLYDGSPNHPDWRVMWRMVEEEGVTVFGCSASYLNYLRGAGAGPGVEFDLSKLRSISQTGSPLSVEGFEWVYREIKVDLHLNSISGGTDINGCFAAGTPVEPVYAGELQGPVLAMKVKAYDEAGSPQVDKVGELVCEAPSPSMPLYFWDDPDGTKYRAAYFDTYPGVWRHGDWIIIHSDTGGITFTGRSDFTLNPSGVRIGSAEIYNIVEGVEGVADSLVVGQAWKGDERVILFIKPAEGFMLDEGLKERIKSALRKEASPRHVPALIVEVPDVPYTFNMKKVESAVSNMVNKRPVTNRDALINPESLDYYDIIIRQFEE